MTSHALVTGASGGIGLEIARLLARRGDRLVVTARSAGRLDEVARELAALGAPDVVVVPGDLGTAAGVESLLRELGARGVEVETLVNNAGFGIAGAFQGQDAAEHAGMIGLNVTALTLLTRGLLPGMLARRRGAILNVASTAGFQPGPWFATYYATKAFVVSLSEALRRELRGTGVRVVTLCPGPTHTGFAARARMKASRLFQHRGVMDAETVARLAVARLETGGLVIPGFLNKVMLQSQRLAPRALVTAITTRLNRERSA